MGNLINLLKHNKVTKKITFIKEYLNIEKIECLKIINEDFFINEETFCSFFMCHSSYFQVFDTNDIGLVNMWEIFMLIYLVKGKSVKTKLESKF